MPSKAAKVPAGKRLRARLEQPEILVMMGTHDVLSARMIEAAGFEALCMGGFPIAGSQLGKPDVGLLTFPEALTWVRNICSVTDLPVLADADTGYGNVTNTMRTVEAYEQAGAAAIILEDQVWPKRCGHMEGKDVVPMKEMVTKLRGAARAREHMLICGRTDACDVHGFDDALARSLAYAEAGADIIFFEAVQTEEQMKILNEKIPAFTLVNLVDHGKTPILPAQRLQELGYDVITIPVALSFFYAKQALKFLKQVRADGGAQNLQNEMLTFDEYNALVGLPQIRALEKELGA